MRPTAEQVGKAVAAGEAAFWLATATVALWAFPLRRLFRSLPHASSAPSLRGAQLATFARSRDAVAAMISILPPRPRCLPAALAGVLMCRVRGVRVSVALSVTNRGGFGAHAVMTYGSEDELSLSCPDGRTHLGRLMLRL
ncbi:MAG: lasso peptide biosynthesis B2 protein [Gemmatimonadota bacterium]